MKLIHAFPAFFLLLSGNTKHPVPPSMDKPALALIEEASVPVRQKTVVTIDRPVVYQGQTFLLEFTVPHAGNMGVIDPSGRFYYLTYPRESAAGNLKPLVDAADFEHMGQLEIDPTRVEGDPYTYGVWDNQKIFTQSGTYRFILGDNLHVDESDDILMFQVVYRHNKPPGRPIAG
jgi:hypothetical protein